MNVSTCIIIIASTEGCVNLVDELLVHLPQPCVGIAAVGRVRLSCLPSQRLLRLLKQKRSRPEPLLDACRWERWHHRLHPVETPPAPGAYTFEALCFVSDPLNPVPVGLKGLRSHPQRRLQLPAAKCQSLCLVSDREYPAPSGLHNLGLKGLPATFRAEGI